MTMGLNAFSGVLTLFQYMGLSILYDPEKLTLWLCMAYPKKKKKSYHNSYQEIAGPLSWL